MRSHSYESRIQQPAVFLGALLAFVVAASESLGQTTSSAAAKIESLVEQLQSEDFDKRTEAFESLLELGPIARQRIETGAQSTSLEMRMRCEKLLQKIDHAEFDRQIAAYRAGHDIEGHKALPCILEFRNLFGADDEARALYCDALVLEQPLLESLAHYLHAIRELPEGHTAAQQRAKLAPQLRSIEDMLASSEFGESEDVNRLLRSRWSDSEFAPIGAREPILALCILIGSLPELQNEKRIQSLAFGFFQDSNLQAVKRSKYVPELRVGASKWLSKVEGRPQALTIAMRLGLKELALILGRKAVDSYARDKGGDLNDDGRDDLAQAALGIVACGRFGDESDLARLSKLLDEQTVIRTWITEEQESYTCELRDLALAYSTYLAKVDPKKLGFPHLEASGETVFALHTISFVDGAQREKAHANWDKLRGNQRKVPPPPTKSV